MSKAIRGWERVGGVAFKVLGSGGGCLAEPSPVRNPFKGRMLLLNSPTGVFPLRHLQCHETCMRFEMKSLFL